MTIPFHQSTMTMSYRRLISGFFLLILLAFGAFSATSTQAQAAAAQAEATPTAQAADASGGPAPPAVRQLLVKENGDVKVVVELAYRYVTYEHVIGVDPRPSGNPAPQAPRYPAGSGRYCNRPTCSADPSP